MSLQAKLIKKHLLIKILSQISLSLYQIDKRRTNKNNQSSGHKQWLWGEREREGRRRHSEEPLGMEGRVVTEKVSSAGSNKTRGDTWCHLCCGEHSQRHALGTKLPIVSGHTGPRWLETHNPSSSLRITLIESLN